MEHIAKIPPPIKHGLPQPVQNVLCRILKRLQIGFCNIQGFLYLIARLRLILGQIFTIDEHADLGQRVVGHSFFPLKVNGAKGDRSQYSGGSARRENASVKVHGIGGFSKPAAGKQGQASGQ